MPNLKMTDQCLITDEMSIKFNMFGASMKNKIVSKGSSSDIVTPKYQSEWQRDLHK